MIEYIESLNWSNEDWALLVSVLAFVSSVLFSFLSYQLSRRNQNLALEKFKHEEEEKSKRKLQISVSHSSKYGNPLKWVGLWMIVSNQGFEQPLLGELAITLTFGRGGHEAEGCLVSLIRVLFRITDDVEFTFGLYSGVASSGSVNDFHYSDRVTMNFYLINWDTKKPIYFAPQKEYRMPAPGEKERWYLFGNLPEDETQRWMEQRYHLKKVALTFITDQGEFEISENITATLVDRKLLMERTGYEFEFEPSHVSSFRRRFRRKH
ncbi:MAG: hypothetical protein ACOYZ8_11225 [Chloroflexota bacterium]